MPESDARSRVGERLGAGWGWVGGGDRGEKGGGGAWRESADHYPVSDPRPVSDWPLNLI